LHNQSFAITAPVGALFTQVRAEVVSFNLTSGFENECVSCKNLPYTWGSIYNASNINTNAAVADSINMGTNPPVIQFTPTLTNTHQNPRETIWGNYSGFTLPSSLNMQFVLPHPSIIGCCTLYVKICVKFTFRDRNCKECEVISCFTVAIPPLKPVITDNPTDKDPTGTAVMTTQKNEECKTCGNNASTSEPGSTVENPNASARANSGIETQSDEDIVKNTEEKINELKQLKSKGIKRGEVELLPEMEKQLKVIKGKK
jgi:hypothetical protein